MNWSLAYLASEWIIRFVMLVYVPQRRSAAASRTWLLLIFLLPWPGLLLYAVFGRIYVPRRRIEMQERASRRIREVQSQRKPGDFEAERLSSTIRSLMHLARQLGDFEAVSGNSVELLTDYMGSISRLVADIDAAQESVHLLYYIFEADEVGWRVGDALTRAAKRGVECRVLMDAVGSKRGLRKLAPALRAAGVEVHAALAAGFFRRNAARFDLRNHRKLAVIDNRVGYTGSQNLVNGKFVAGYPNEELQARLTGPIVAQLQAVFLADHFFETDQVPAYQEHFPELAPTGHSPAQLLPSGPGYGHENGQEFLVALLYAARQRVVITTPYFVPDEPVLQAISAARLRGVEVHLVVSLHANQLVTQLAQRSFYEALLECGVQIHRYQPRFLHAKHLTVDEEIAVLGSTNIDIRSFALNAEINLVVYDPAVVGALRNVQKRYFENSLKLSAEEWQRRPLIQKVLQNSARLADSLL
ncbi:MAG TPA: cardiolipin synthase [Candidatus Acidoferrum sp.]|nr:cardiolipin synthase [Candidatus Acidoferrum sp.]